MMFETPKSPGSDQFSKHPPEPQSPVDSSVVTSGAKVTSRMMENILFPTMAVFERWLVKGNTTVRFNQGEYVPHQLNVNAISDPNNPKWIDLNESEKQFWKLLRFLRNFIAHYRKVPGEETIFKEVLALAGVLLAHSGKKESGQDRIRTFLGESGSKRLTSAIPEETYSFPQCFLPQNGVVNYPDQNWYAAEPKDSITLKDLTMDFTEFMESAFKDYYNDRLAERNRQAPVAHRGYDL